MNNKNLILTIIAIIVVGAGSFYGGMKYQQGRAGADFASRFGGRNSGNFAINRQDTRNGGPNGNASNFRPVVGQVLSIDNNTVTVKMQDGSSKIVILSDSTTYSQNASASESDVKVGDNIAATGTSNSDGSLTAENVQLNPEFRAFGVRSITPTATQ